MEKKPRKADHSITSPPSMPSLVAAFTNGETVIFGLSRNRLVEVTVQVLKKDATGTRLTVKGIVLSIGTTVQSIRRRYTASYPIDGSKKQTMVFHAVINQ